MSTRLQLRSNSRASNMLHQGKHESTEWETVEDASYSTRLNRWILKPIGVWPERSFVPWHDRYLANMAKAVCYVLMALLLIPTGLYVILEEKDTYTRLQLSGALLFCLMACMKYSSLILRQDDIRRCVECIAADWRQIKHLEDRRIMSDNANFGMRLVIIYGSIMCGSAVIYYLALPILVGKLVEDGNFTYRPLVCPVARVIADTRSSPMNEIFFSIQCASGILNYTITAGACSLAAVFAMHACGQLQVLMAWIKHLVDGREDLSHDVDCRFAVVIEQHNRILSFLCLMENVLRQISLVDVSGCTLQMCLIVYYALMEWGTNDLTRIVSYIILFVSLTFNIFIFCYIGELVNGQCKKVGEAFYMTEWYRLPRGRSLGLILTISMSNSTMKLTAGNLIDLSLSSFGDVVKTSVAYLNMLRTMTT